MNIKIPKRRALVAWMLRKILTLPKECPYCGKSVTYDQIQRCFTAPFDQK